jgi:hypothetical protein
LFSCCYSYACAFSVYPEQVSPASANYHPSCPPLGSHIDYISLLIYCWFAGWRIKRRYPYVHIWNFHRFDTAVCFTSNAVLFIPRFPCLFRHQISMLDRAHISCIIIDFLKFWAGNRIWIPYEGSICLLYCLTTIVLLHISSKTTFSFEEMYRIEVCFLMPKSSGFPFWPWSISARSIKEKCSTPEHHEKIHSTQWR